MGSAGASAACPASLNPPGGIRRLPRSRSKRVVAVRAREERTDALGGQDYILSQASGVKEELYKGSVLGVDADVATGDLRTRGDIKQFGDIKDHASYHIPDRFLDRFACHVAKNLLTDGGCVLGATPLMLCVWGGKGVGKSFNLELCCKRLGVMPVVVSAGELEDPTAGEPGAMLRRRYLTASKHMSTSGVPTCLIVNDVDAGVGRFKDDKVTVNNQIAQATLMNLCDEPTRVSVGGEWRSDDRATCRRVPVIVTANDPSVLYAPLTRNGRMDLWMWEPTREEIAKMVHDALDGAPGYGGERDALELVAAFPSQPLDFFGAVRSRCADDAVRRFIAGTGLENLSGVLCGHRGREGGDPSWSASGLTGMDASLPSLLAAGAEVAREQQNVMDVQLSRDYVANWTEEPSAGEIRERRVMDRRMADANSAALEAAEEARLASIRARAEAASARSRSAEAVAAEESARRALAEASRRAKEEGVDLSIAVGVSAKEPDAEEVEREAMYAEEDALPWRVVDAIDCFRSLKEGTCVLLDVRPRKDHDREAIKGSLSAPAANLSGGISDRVITPDLDNMTTRVAKMTDKLRDKTVVVVGDGEPYVRDAIRVLGEVLGEEVVEMRGGQAAWLKYYTPAGKPRPRYVGYGKDNEETFWTASN